MMLSAIRLTLLMQFGFLTHVIADEPAPKLKYSVERDVVYGKPNGYELKADIYRPSEAKQITPIVIIVHGGAWRSGDKWMPATYARLLAENSIAAMAINYRLAPTHKFPKQADDLRFAMLWARENAESEHWDINRLGLFGYSAGAHLCSLIGSVDDEPLETKLKTSNFPPDHTVWKDLPRPKAIVAGGTPCDFRSLPDDHSLLSYFFGGTPKENPDAYNFGSPSHLATPGDVQTMFYHGSSDLIVPIAGSRLLHKQHLKLGLASEFVEIENFGHFFSFMHPDARSSTLRFFQERLLGK